MNTRLPLKNILLLALSASLLNVSLSLALPAQPPANGALTPNFTNVNVDTKVTATELEIGEITSKNPANDVVFMDGVEIRGDILATNVTAEDEVYTSWLYANNLRSRTDADPIILHDNLEVDGGLEVDGTFKTDRIEMLNNDGQPVRFGADVYIEDRLQVETMAYLPESTNIGNATLMGYIGSKIYRNSSTTTNSVWKSVSCNDGDIVLSCGASSITNQPLRKLYSYPAGGTGTINTCGAAWPNIATSAKVLATCLDL